MVSIATTHLRLREFGPDDLPAYQRLRSEAKFQRFYSEEDSAPEKSKLLLEMFIAQSQVEPRTKFQLAVVSPAGELMGSCGIRVEAPGQASMGCELGRPWHASGAAREACEVLLEFGFRELKLQRIYAETITENKAATRLCQLIGMRTERERVEDHFFKGRAWGATVLAILDTEWRARNK